jgi:hypothetical protein
MMARLSLDLCVLSRWPVQEGAFESFGLIDLLELVV